MRTKHQLKTEIARVNELLKSEAIELMLGTKKSLGRLEEARNERDRQAFTYWAMLEFREYVRRQLEKHGVAPATGLINGGARLLRLSPATTKRYMDSLRTGGGPFSGLGDQVTINPNYKPVEEDDYWLDLDEPEEGTDNKSKRGKP